MTNIQNPNQNLTNNNEFIVDSIKYDQDIQNLINYTYINLNESNSSNLTVCFKNELLSQLSQTKLFKSKTDSSFEG